MLCLGFLFTYSTAVAVFFRRRAPGARIFSFFLLFVSLWALIYFFETMASDGYWKKILFYFKYLIIINIPVLFLQFSMEFTGTTRWERILIHSLLLVFSIVIIGLIFLNPFNLVFVDIDIIERNGISLFEIERGPLHNVIDIFLLLISILGLLLLILRMNLKNHDQRNHFLIILTAISIPGLGIFLEIWDVGFFGMIDTPTLFFLFSAIVIDIGMIKFDLFHINTMSRERLMDKINEGIIFINSKNLVIDMNRRAGEILGIEKQTFKEKPVGILNSELDRTLKDMERNNRTNGEFSIGREETIFEVRSTLIESQRGSVLGRLVLLQDITERKSYQKALVTKKEELKNSNEILEVINKILRHDLMNDLMVMKMAKGTFGRTGDLSVLDKMDSSLDRSISLIKRMRELEMSINKGKKFYPVTLEKVFKEASFKFDIPVSVKGSCRVLADEAVFSIVMNLLTNAKKHGNANRIEVNMMCGRDFCEAVISDNGKGMPVDVAERIFDEGFSHGTSRGSGLGMYIVKRTMERYGGSARIIDSGPNGTRVLLRFRTA
jgi:PAS domain S-box-containing protein